MPQTEAEPGARAPVERAARHAKRCRRDAELKLGLRQRPTTAQEQPTTEQFTVDGKVDHVAFIKAHAAWFDRWELADDVDAEVLDGNTGAREAWSYAPISAPSLISLSGQQFPRARQNCDGGRGHRTSHRANAPPSDSEGECSDGEPKHVGAVPFLAGRTRHLVSSLARIARVSQ
jgi:hypothetical protein